MVQVTDKRGANHKPAPEPKEVTEAAEGAEELLQEQARRAAEDEAANKEQPGFPPDTVFATTAFLMIQLQDGRWMADPNYGRPVAIEREANSSDMIGGCAVVQAYVTNDIGSDMAAGKTLANFRAMGQQMAAERQVGDTVPGDLKTVPNRAARRQGRPGG